MDKDILINKLTLLDTASFRCRALCHNNNAYATLVDGLMPVKEPVGFRARLRDVYDELSVEQLMKIYKFKKGEHND
jgi:hypothetical protein